MFFLHFVLHLMGVCNGASFPDRVKGASRPQTGAVSHPLHKAEAGDTDSGSCCLCNRRQSLLPGPTQAEGLLVKTPVLPRPSQLPQGAFTRSVVLFCLYLTHF